MNGHIDCMLEIDKYKGEIEKLKKQNNIFKLLTVILTTILAVILIGNNIMPWGYFPI